ncbi:MAG TPA: geranylgeranyl reductase family protein [Parafilimonas sp.]|nr:geranylgeranyl reductase family protein [Parafilimonas sp.]
MKSDIDNNMFDITIIGAGPAGCAAALALRNSGLHVAVIDKHIFPRDKVCGDAIPGRAIACLKEIYPSFSDELALLDKKLVTKSTACFYNNKTVEFNWVQEAYTSTRMDFDNFLFSIVKTKTQVEIFEGIEIKDITKSKNGFNVHARNNKIVFATTMIIGADGINGITAKKLAGYQIDRKHHVASVRAYYKNVDDLKETRTEIYFDKKYLPGYFWIFPLNDGISNVGFGMLSEDVAQKNINLKKSFYDFIERSQTLQNKFKPAKQEGNLMGCGLPLGSKWVSMSGDNFILTGDAASLIDPASGSGIGNAVLSGQFAAEQVIKSFATKNFSAEFMKAYDKKLYKEIGTELKRNGFALKYLSRIPFFINLGFSLGKSNFLKKFVK